MRPHLRPPRPSLHIHANTTPTTPRHQHRQQQYHTTRPRAQDHYATLQIPPSASPAEVKRSFYALSKKHHPDRNPNDQDAANKRFVAIGDAYAVLSDPAKRSAYDRERAPATAPAPSGSYSSAQYTPGGRPASGLSRRRNHFRGPPPSFYRSGGWGSASAKRAENAERDGRTEWERLRREEEDGGGGGAAAFRRRGDGSGLGENDVPHFDRERHYKTTSTVEEQLRQGRRKRRKVVVEDMMADGGGSEVRAFFLVSGVILVGVGGPVLWWSTGHS